MIMTPHVHFPAIMVPQPDGSFRLRPGAPVVANELTTAQFAKLVSLSQRTIQTLCDEGKIKCRRATNRKESKILIPIGELEKFKQEQ